MNRSFAGRYGDLEKWHWWFRGRQQILEEAIRRELKGRVSLSVASLGCGPVEGLGWLLPFTGTSGRLVGIDADPAHARQGEDNIHSVVGRAEAIPLASDSFDVVLALDVLEHLDDDSAALSEAVRLLKPDGILFVTVPALPSLWGTQDIVSHHRRRYTKRTLEYAFARARLSRPRVTYFNFLLFAPIAMIRWARRIAGSSSALKSDFDNSHPGLTNDLLAAIFAFERHLIWRTPIPVGVSLLGALRR